MPTKYYLNLNYVCNERCIFCASDLTNHVRLPGRKPVLTLDDIESWLDGVLPGPTDRVMLAGGEPTLHRDLLPIVRLLGQQCRDVVIFTNGLRLAEPAFARDAVEAGITRFEIALFGATAASHDAVTRVRGSFERTLVALANLVQLRADHDFTVEVRLLVSRQCVPENPDVVRLVRERVPGVDAFSLNRLILSEHAKGVDATISWGEARASINECARLVREGGYELVYDAMPLCLYDGDNAEYVRAASLARLARQAAGREPRRWEMRYLDPVVAAGETAPGQDTRVALPDPCLRCDALGLCGRVESWYARRFGTADLHPIRLRLPEPAAAPA